MRKIGSGIILGRNAPVIIRTAAIALAVIVVLTVILLVLSRTADPTSTVEYSAVIKRGTLRVGVLNDMPRFSENGSGLEVDLAHCLAREFFPEKGAEGLSTVELSSTMMSARLSDSTVDFAIMLAPMGQSTGQYAYSSAYYTDVCLIATPAGAQSISSLDSKSIGVINGSIEKQRLEDYREDNALSFTITSYASYELMLQALSSSKVDAVALRGADYYKYSQNYSLSAGLEFSTVDYAIVCSKDSPALAQIASMMIDRMSANGELEELLTKYGL